MPLRDVQRRAAAAVARRLGEPYRILRYRPNQDRGPQPDATRAPLDVRAMLHGALGSGKADANISGRHHIVAETLGRSETALVPLSEFPSRAEWPLAGDRLQALDDAGVARACEPLLEVVTAEPDRTAQLVLKLSRVPA